MANSIRQQATHFLCLGRAVTVAVTSCESMFNMSDPISFVILGKQRIELNIAKRQYQLDFLDKLASLSPIERAHIVFDLIDADGNGCIELPELAWSLQLINGDDRVEEDLPLAAKSINAFDKDNDGKLNKDEFLPFLETLSQVMECSTWELCEHFCTVLAFQARTGEMILQDTVRAMMGSHELLAEDVADACDEARLLLIFGMLDTHQRDEISFKTFVEHLTVFRDVHYSLPRKIANMMDQMSRRSKKLGYDQFSEILRSIVQSTSTDLNILANCLTLAAVEKITSKTFMDQFDHDLILHSKAVVVDLNDSDLPSPERLDVLFQLFDTNHNGVIDLGELVLGIRKFQSNKELDETFNETLSALLSVDNNDDKLLDRQEFSHFIQNLAASCGADIDDLVDFMILQSAYVDSSVEESKQVNSWVLSA